MRRKPKELQRYIDEHGVERVIRKHPGGGVHLAGQETVLQILGDWITAEVARRIREARAQRGLSQMELAVAAGLAPSKPRMKAIEDGRCGIRLATLYGIAAALSVEPTDLLPSLADALRETGVSTIGPVVVEHMRKSRRRGASLVSPDDTAPDEPARRGVK